MGFALESQREVAPAQVRIVAVAAAAAAATFINEHLLDSEALSLPAKWLNAATETQRTCAVDTRLVPESTQAPTEDFWKLDRSFFDNMVFR
jgi:hypothetical protein